MQTGTINIQTENIFPIIKKFLYSDTEIFLRELVSNAVDASQKLKTLSKTGEFNQEVNNLRVEVILDKDAKTITIRDNGIGMTGEEVEKYINQIAFSGAKEFAEKYADKDANAMIGHFGLGFYSAFMVSEKVQIQTLSYKEGSKAVQWESDGSPTFTLGEIEKADRGTDIILHVGEDSVEFLEEARLSEILSKYCKFLPVEIKFGTRKTMVPVESGEKDEQGNVKKEEKEIENIINNTQPTWIKKPTDKAVMMCTIFFDYNLVYGDTALVSKLSKSILDSIQSFEIFLNFLGRNALRNPTPLGFFRQFLVEHDGEHKDQFDLKSRALMPLIDAARLIALSHGIKDKNNTITRYNKLATIKPHNNTL